VSAESLRQQSIFRGMQPGRERPAYRKIFAARTGAQRRKQRALRLVHLRFLKRGEARRRAFGGHGRFLCGFCALRDGISARQQAAYHSSNSPKAPDHAEVTGRLFLVDRLAGQHHRGDVDYAAIDHAQLERRGPRQIKDQALVVRSPVIDRALDAAARSQA
jgi:hypothetical protein